MTHALRIVRGMLLKGNGLGNHAGSLADWGFTLVVAVIAMWSYRETLD